MPRRRAPQAAADSARARHESRSGPPLIRLHQNQIFVGMVSGRVQPKPHVQDMITELMTAGVRFVFASTRNYKQTKPLATKMGLETGWNCAISLKPRHGTYVRARVLCAGSP